MLMWSKDFLNINEGERAGSSAYYWRRIEDIPEYQNEMILIWSCLQLILRLWCQNHIVWLVCLSFLEHWLSVYPYYFLMAILRFVCYSVVWHIWKSISVVFAFINSLFFLKRSFFPQQFSALLYNNSRFLWNGDLSFVHGVQFWI